LLRRGEERLPQWGGREEEERSSTLNREKRKEGTCFSPKKKGARDVSVSEKKKEKGLRGDPRNRSGRKTRCSSSGEGRSCVLIGGPQKGEGTFIREKEEENKGKTDNGGKQKSGFIVGGGGVFGSLTCKNGVTEGLCEKRQKKKGKTEL